MRGRGYERLGRLLLLGLATCGRAPDTGDCRSKGTLQAALVGKSCDGPDRDLCEEGVWLCGTAGELTCGDTTDDSREICNGADDDCDGEVDPGCDCDLLAPPDCDPDGDGLPPRICTPPALTGGETVACVCSTPPCGDPLCTTSHTTVDDALAAVGVLSAPTEVWLFSGAYPGFRVANTGADVTRPLRIAARCVDGERDSVSLISNVVIIDSYVTLEGFRLDLGTFIGAGIWITDSSMTDGDQTTLRDLTITGSGVAVAPSEAYVAVYPVNGAEMDGLTLENVDIYGSPSGSRAVGLYAHSVNNVNVRHSSVCRLDTAGGDTGILIDGSSHLVERTLVRDVDIGIGGGADSYVFDELSLVGCRSFGIEFGGGGGTITNSRFVDNANGLKTYDNSGLFVFNNLFARNAGYGAWWYRDDDCCNDIDGFVYNTFADNGSAGLVLEGVPERKGYRVERNIFAGHRQVGLVYRNFTMEQVQQNLFFDNATDCSCTGTACGNATDCQSAQVSLAGDPAFVSGPGGFTYMLSQAPDQPIMSAAVDASREAAAAACYAGTCLATRTTSTLLAADSGAADLGFHHPICP